MDQLKHPTDSWITHLYSRLANAGWTIWSGEEDKLVTLLDGPTGRNFTNRLTFKYSRHPHRHFYRMWLYKCRALTKYHAVVSFNCGLTGPDHDQLMFELWVYRFADRVTAAMRRLMPWIT